MKKPSEGLLVDKNDLIIFFDFFWPDYFCFGILLLDLRQQLENLFLWYKDLKTNCSENEAKSCRLSFPREYSTRNAQEAYFSRCTHLPSVAVWSVSGARRKCCLTQHQAWATTGCGREGWNEATSHTLLHLPLQEKQKSSQCSLNLASVLSLIYPAKWLQFLLWILETVGDSWKLMSFINYCIYISCPPVSRRRGHASIQPNANWPATINIG